MQKKTANEERERRLQGNQSLTNRDEALWQDLGLEQAPQRRTLSTSSVAATPTVEVTRLESKERRLLRERQARQRKILNAVFTAFYGDEGANGVYADFFEAITFQLRGGVPLAQAIRQSLSVLPESERKPMEFVAYQVERGVPLHKALATIENLPALVAPIIEAGERNGNLAQSLWGLTFAFRKYVAIEHKLDYSVLHPAIGSLVLFALVTIAAVFAIEQPLVVMGAVAAGGVSSYFAFRHWRDRLKKRMQTAAGRKIGHLPSRDGALARSFTTARWGRTFATLWQNDVPISQALEIAATEAGNPHYERALRRAANETRNGKRLSEALAETRSLPKRLLDTIQTGEETGDLGVALEDFADFLEDDAKMLGAQMFTLRILIPGVLLLLGAALMALSPIVGLLVMVAGMLLLFVMFRLATAGEQYE